LRICRESIKTALKRTCVFCAPTKGAAILTEVVMVWPKDVGENTLEYMNVDSPKDALRSWTKLQ
jgi:hypothetical protein